MKKVICVIAIILIIISIVVIQAMPSTNINLCYKYSKAYLSKFPTSQEEIEDIGQNTEKFLNQDVFDERFYFSKYFYRYCIDKLLLSSAPFVNETEIKKSYNNEIIILQLKYCLLKEDFVSFHKLFVEHFEDLETDKLSPGCLTFLIKNGSNTIDFDSSQYIEIEKNYWDLYKNTEDNIKKYFIISALIECFYGHYPDETSIELQECYDEREKLIEKIGPDKLKQVYADRNNVTF